MNKLKAHLIFFVSLIILSCFNPVYAEKEILEDDRVYFGFSPKYVTGGWTNFELYSKKFQGDINFILGVNTDRFYPSRIDYFFNKTVYEDYFYTIPERYYNGSLYYDMTFNFSSQDANYVYNGYVELLDYNFNSSEWDRFFAKSFIAASKNDYEIYYQESYFLEWKQITRKKLDWNVSNHEFLEMDKWFSTRFNIVKDRLYRFRIWFTVIPEIEGSLNKFVIGFKPADMGLYEAVDKNRLYVLDPYYNTSFPYRKNVTVQQTTGAGQDYQVMFTAVNGSGTDLNNVFYSSNWANSSFSDLRVVNGNQTIEYDHYKETVNVGSNCSFWVEIRDDLGADDVNLTFYYGLIGAADVSNGDNTFLLFDHFDDGSLDLAKWDIVAGSPSVSSSEVELEEGDDIESDLDFGGGTAIRGKVKYTNIGGTDAAVFGYNSHYDDSERINMQSYGGTANFRGLHYDGIGGGTVATNTARDSAYHVIDIMRNYTVGVYFDIDGADPIEDLTDVAQNSYPCQFDPRHDRVEEIVSDWVFVRKYVRPEPSVFNWSNEEHYTEPAIEVAAIQLDHIYWFMLVLMGFLMSFGYYSKRQILSGMGTITGLMLGILLLDTQVIVGLTLIMVNLYMLYTVFFTEIWN